MNPLRGLYCGEYVLLKYQNLYENLLLHNTRRGFSIVENAKKA